MNFEKEISELQNASKPEYKTIFRVNAHIHTPYSFSAFNSINEAAELAYNENVKILGINDFYTTDGYDEFYNACINKKIYPLFNIEFIGLIKEFQSKCIRINDPNNPGRIYFSGKGLKYPFHLNNSLLKKTKKLQEGNNEQTKLIIEKANTYFYENNILLKLDFDYIKTNYAENIVRERHIAKAIRIYTVNEYKNIEERKSFLKKLYSGKETLVNVNNYNALEIEIRSRLLKSGGPAFVPEDENVFLNITEIIEIIINAGGIPCYPVLLDDDEGKFTDFEKDWNKMHNELTKLNIGCIELIPCRNSSDILENFVRFFDERNYIILFGTEHNTPDLIPINVTCRNNIPLTNELLKISYEGACVVAAHQYLNSKNKEGYINIDGKVKVSLKKDFIKLGNVVIHESYL